MKQSYKFVRTQTPVRRDYAEGKTDWVNGGFW
jgi:hypothetical protein